MPESGSSSPPSEKAVAAWSGATNGLVDSLVDYHWYQAAWDREEIELLKRFFSQAGEKHPDLASSLADEFAKLSTIPAGSNTPGLMAQYLLAVARSFSEPGQLAERLVALRGTDAPQATASSIVDCTGMALRKTTAIAFELHANHIKQCASTVAALQKLFFFHAALLRDVFSNTESFTAGGFDETTGLPDHRTTLSNLVELLANRRETQKPLALLIIHIAFSHLATDATAYAESEVLFAQAADRLQRALRDTDIIGRFSRDEFAIILPNASGIGLAILAANKIIRTLEDPFDVDTRHALAKPTLGISLFPDHGQEAEMLLHHAEIARDVARQSKEHYAVYDQEFHRQNRLRRSLEAMLRTALQENELQVFFQPQADLRTGRIVGAESLLRWHLPDTGLVPPTQIISVAEESGLISALTMWVFNSSLRHLAALAKAGIDISVSVNVTPSNLSDPELPDFLAQALGTWNVPANKLVVELTETAMIGDSERTIDTLHRLKSMGLALSIDDFGTGYSSMAYLKKMPLDELKVDQVFVRNMLSAREDERIVRSVIDLAHHFDLKVVAEGVEDLMTLEFLRALGCDVAQGYLISKPVPIAEFSDWWLKRKGLLVRTDLA